MCKASTPKYEKPPEYARPAEPDNAAIHREALARETTRSGGSRSSSASSGITRSTVLTGLQGVTTPPVLGAQTGKRGATTLG